MKKKVVKEEKDQIKSLSLFDHLDNLTKNKVPFDPMDDSQKSYEPYMINRFVSMVEVYLPFVNEINLYGNYSKQSHYNYYLSCLPKTKQYFNYIKKSKDVLIEEKKLLMRYFECGTREVEGYIKILTNEQIQSIVKKYENGRA